MTSLSISIHREKKTWLTLTLLPCIVRMQRLALARSFRVASRIESEQILLNVLDIESEFL